MISLDLVFILRLISVYVVALCEPRCSRSMAAVMCYASKHPLCEVEYLRGRSYSGCR